MSVIRLDATAWHVLVMTAWHMCMVVFLSPAALHTSEVSSRQQGLSEGGSAFSELGQQQTFLAGACLWKLQPQRLKA